MSKIKAGIIGIGSLGHGMVEVFDQHPKFELISVCDTNEVILNKTVEQFDIEGYTSYKDLLEKSDVDMVYIAVPPKWHHPITMDAIKAGKHILCEKPLANSLEDAKEMLDEVSKTGLIHSMNFPLNYVASTRKFEELLQEGFIGKLRRVEVNMEFPVWPRHWQQNSWINTREQGGFVFEVTGHFIQLINRFFGSITDVESKLEFPEDSSLPETGMIAQMKVQNVPVLIKGISGTAGTEEQKLSLTAYGTEGTLSLIDLMILKAGKLGEEFLDVPLENIHFWNELLNEFVAAIEGKPHELYTFESGYEVQEVLENLRNPKLELIK
ncbi:Gfo/Idh/MocA family oxidoreductase [Bacillus sp. 31A1R]|uniref:Gfo/Idh/MocA family oxidoreductase n=1 Tax=Robertmurraya mangrovi TaxID=3098077 RepID=A0ABU5IVS4_9BACI|nr:Gfo/Idh/MocA family oxidoreductase [Bacillus sp. 31A1R]MDZ5471257.1 Gfo/Idh/MocA family oxidoreductase [Bacillus sp. 31A1R]